MRHYILMPICHDTIALLHCYGIALLLYCRRTMAWGGCGQRETVYFRKWPLQGRKHNRKDEGRERMMAREGRRPTGLCVVGRERTMERGFAFEGGPFGVETEERAKAWRGQDVSTWRKTERGRWLGKDVGRVRRFTFESGIRRMERKKEWTTTERGRRHGGAR